MSTVIPSKRPSRARNIIVKIKKKYRQKKYRQKNIDKKSITKKVLQNQIIII